jgi:hypothetical protein
VENDSQRFAFALPTAYAVPKSMIRKLAALLLLVLILTPFTAPFQTCAPRETSSPVLIEENDPASLVMSERHERNAPSAFGASVGGGVVCSGAFPGGPIASRNPATARAIVSTVLRR